MSELTTIPGPAASGPVDFLNWAVMEVERLRDESAHNMDRQERFRIQNVAATIQAAANLYGEWLAKNARLPDPPPGS